MAFAALREAESLAEYAANPAGLYVRGQCFLSLCQSDSLYGGYLWGRPNAEQTRRFIEVLRVEMRPQAVRHHAFMDLTGLTWVDSDAFVLMREFLKEVEPRQVEITAREAVVRPSGVAGAVVAGFFALQPPPYPSKTFADATEAARWLEVEPAVHREWERLRESVNGVAPELARVREVLATHYREADVAFVAECLNWSARTLQRRLKAWRTGFQQELDAARLEQAKARLSGTDDKLAAVAAEIGFSSAQHFSEWFRAQTGVTAETLRRPRSLEASVSSPR